MILPLENLQMSKLVKRGTEAQSVPVDVMRLLANNKEVLIITANPDQSESNIAVYSKLLDDGGVLSGMMVEILTNLMLTARKNEKCAI